MAGGGKDDAVQIHPLGHRVLAQREPSRVRDERLDDEGADNGQVSGHAGEAPHLVLLGEQREERVEHHEDEAVGALDVHVGEVTDADRDAVASWLGPQLGHHGLGRVDAVHLETPLEEGEGNAPGADPELEHRPRSRQVRQQLDGSRSVETVTLPLVIDVGSQVAIG